jgi:hypothetical protein
LEGAGDNGVRKKVLLEANASTASFSLENNPSGSIEIIQTIYFGQVKILKALS